MKQMIAFILLAFFAQSTLAENALPFVVQLKYSPWGVIDADEDEFDRGDENYEKYEMEFERNIGAKIIFPFAPIYIGAQQSVTNLDNSTPDAKVETFAIGFGGVAYDKFASNSGIYLMGGVGAGTGKFTFKDPVQNDWEAFMEGNAEIGLRIQEHLLLGIGVDYQHFGKPGESKANFWNLYIGTGLVF
jgi:hypothetical protein